MVGLAYRPIGRVLLDSVVPRLVAERPAVVLERLAAGGDRWYRCPDLGGLAVLGPRLLPGSVVSFYFDQRIAWRAWTPLVRAEALARTELAARSGGHLVIGCATADGLALRVLAACRADDVDACVHALGPAEALLLGAFPDPDDDGTAAVTLTLPGSAPSTRRP